MKLTRRLSKLTLIDKTLLKIMIKIFKKKNRVKNQRRIFNNLPLKNILKTNNFHNNLRT
jgi:acid stress-induced BolA-like protein IbaG/YrbA